MKTEYLKKNGKIISSKSSGNLPHEFKMKLKLIYDRQSVGQSVLVPGTHLEPVTNFFSLLKIFFRQLQVCYFVAPSLTTGRVCNLLYIASGACQSGHSWIEVPQNSRPYFTVSSETVSLFVASYDSQGLRWRYSKPPPHGVSTWVIFGRRQLLRNGLLISISLFLESHFYLQAVAIHWANRRRKTMACRGVLTSTLL
jgi:hypothetical protein